MIKTKHEKMRFKDSPYREDELRKVIDHLAAQVAIWQRRYNGVRSPGTWGVIVQDKEDVIQEAVEFVRGTEADNGE